MQTDDPQFGADVGGVNPAFFAINAAAEFDSWLTIGMTDASAPGALATSPSLRPGRLVAVRRVQHKTAHFAPLLSH